MPTAEQVAGWLTGITYKPDAQFSTFEEPWMNGGVTAYLRIHRTLPDSTRGPYTLVQSTDPASWALVQHTAEVPPYIRSRESFIEWVWSQIRGMELHEAGEWFSVDGHLEHDPHRLQGS